jgi:UDP-2,3-diacylglucosamine hydrolase
MLEFDNALIISDVHLTPAYPHTANRFIDFCQKEAREIQALFIIGDLFEFWVGDDAHLNSPCHQQIAHEIALISQSGVPVFFIAGNRDFMLGDHFAQLANWTVLPDPSLVKIGHQHYLLSHGDRLCSADSTYQLFRSFTRVHFIQKLFMQIPASYRKKLGEGLRKRATMKYQMRQNFDPTTANSKGNVTLTACSELTIRYQCEQLIHGHTHLPGYHQEQRANHSWKRWVLSDWDLDHPEMHPRASALRIDHDGIRAIDLIES